MIVDDQLVGPRRKATQCVTIPWGVVRGLSSPTNPTKIMRMRQCPEICFRIVVGFFIGVKTWRFR